MRAAGLSETYSPASESNADVLRHLLDSGVDGRRIAVQLHGEPLRVLAQALRHGSPRFRAGGRDIELRGQAVVIDGVLREVPPAPIAVLRALAARPGHVVSRRELVAVLPGSGEEHAVETAVGRLRSALGTGALVQTVVKRGYRLAVRPHGTEAAD